MSKKKSSGWKIVWEIYPFCNLCKGCIKPIILTALTLIPLLFSKKTPFEHIEIVSTLITSAFPSIIGFVLTGYALIIGFSSSEIISYLAKDRNEKKYSLFQIVNSTFAIVMGAIICSFLYGTFCQFIQKAQVPFLFSKGFDCFNYLVLFLLLFSLYYSICSLLDIVINIFNLGQFANTLAKRKYQENENKKNITVKKKSFFEKIIDCLFTKKTHD